MCVGNLASRFTAKLVHFFLATYIVDNLRQHDDDLKQFDDGVNNVSVRTTTVSPIGVSCGSTGGSKITSSCLFFPFLFPMLSCHV